MSFSNIRFIALMAFTTSAIFAFAPQANAASLETVKFYVSGCINEFESMIPGMKEKLKTTSDSDLLSLSESLNELEALNVVEDLEDFIQMNSITKNPETGEPFSSERIASFNISACFAKMRIAKIRNGNKDLAISNDLFSKSNAAAGADSNMNQAEVSAAGDKDNAGTATLTTGKDFDSCQPAIDAQEKEFKSINARNPNTQTIAMGTSIPAVVPGMQVLLYMTEQRMTLLDDYCKGQPQYSQYQSIKNSHDETMKACLRSTSDNSVCKPNLPW